MPPLPSLTGMMDFVFGNIMWFMIGGVILWAVLNYLKVSTKFKPKPLNRSEVERMKFIERMKHNKVSKWKYITHGTKRVGKILAYREFTIKANPKPDKKIIQMIFKPMLIFKLSNPFAKTQAMQLDAQFIDLDMGGKALIIPRWLTLDYYLGIYYDLASEREHTELIKQDNLFRTDMNQLASIYFAKSQEQSTFDPAHAHQLAMKEKELQIEMSKKKGQITSI